jgi:hypothetical protein
MAKAKKNGADAPAEPAAEQSVDNPVVIATETMLGDLMKVCADELKAAKDVWQKLPQWDQDMAIERIERRCKHAVEQAVRIIASEARATILATLESVTAKDQIKAVLTLSKGDPQRHGLLDACGQPVLIVLASTEQFEGGKDAVKSDPDQPTLPLQRQSDRVMSEGEADYTLLRSAGYEITAEQIDALTSEQADALDDYLSDLVSPKRRDAATPPEWLSAYAVKQAA